MMAYHIMDGEVKWKTWSSTAIDGHYAIYYATDRADWRESGVLIEDTLNAHDFMQEATRLLQPNGNQR